MKKLEAAASRQEIPVHNTDPETGLTGAQAKQRLEGGWGNNAPESASRTEQEIILTNTFTFFNLIFVVLAALLVFSGSSVKNMAFLIIALCNTAIGIYQEIRAKRAVDALTLIAQRSVQVVRDGQIIQLPPEQAVRDDIMLLAPGDQISADCVVCAGKLEVNESLVTGEADAISKTPGDSLLSGSFVVAGNARVRLTAVGNDAFASRLAKEAKADPRATKSEMMRALDKLIRVIGFGLIPVGGLLFYQQYAVLQTGLRTATESTVAALIGMIPEGLYLLTSVALAVSARKLASRQVLVQDMNCIETLARVDVLCVDKTGTVTENKMEVENIQPLTADPPEYLEAALTALFSGNDENETARAMAEMFPGDSPWACSDRIPFNASYKWSGGIFPEQGAFLAGAPEVILGSRYAEVAAFSADWPGCRVILAARYEGDLAPGQVDENAVTPLALIMLTNRVRPEAPETFRYFASQGVQVKVISGDNPVTVSEVALRAGIPGGECYVDARTLLTEEDIFRAAETYTVFGRVTPDQKRILVQSLKKQGHTVAMTGDGVNDVLAMRDADCSIAMGGGAQAASQVSKMVLLDSDFSAMPDIVGEGRRVMGNIRRTATLFLVKNIFSLTLALITLFTLWPYPIVPVHLSVISGLTIGIPSFFLAMEPNYDRVKGKFLPAVVRSAISGGLTNVFVVLAAQAYMVVFKLPQDQISTVCASILAFTGLLVLYQVCKPFNRFRKIIWFSMAAALVGCFTLLGDFFTLETRSIQAGLVMGTLLIMTPSVFLGLSHFFSWMDTKVLCYRNRRQEDADL